MAGRRGYAWSSLAICVAIVLAALLLHGAFGDIGPLYTVLLIPIGPAVFIRTPPGEPASRRRTWG
ncbi:hypothetical protein ABZW11_09060 [Nonomuraea sp. NPDC004580]|uniref:hypothetical protein n=1 Tax=Nonomuraea sp. NPDC004580 TaxID=3154552 RepID=UPI0033A5CAF5